MTVTGNEHKHGSALLLALATLASVLTCTQGHVLEFSVEPSDTVVEAGQSAVLACAVKGGHHQLGVFTQWLDQDYQKFTFIGDPYRSQLANGSLYINSVMEEQRLTGVYRCMATLPNMGSILSRSAILSVASLRGFLDEPRDLTVFVGQRAHFACAADANPPPRIRWLKDERPFKIDELRMTILPSGALEIDEVIESDQGAYRCNASGLSAYRLSNKATLTVNTDPEQGAAVASPTFIAQPRSAVVIEGQNVSLDCAANGNPKLGVIWLKDGVAIDMNFLDSRFALVGSTYSLRITNIREEDAGTYHCRAQNREDSLDASATIQVQVPPRFLTKPQDETESTNKDIEMQCSVYGIPEPTIQWLKNGEVITPSEYYQIVNGHNLKIMGLMTSDAGIFQCFAANPAGNVQAAASLKVINTEPKRSRGGGHKNRNAKKYKKEQSDQRLPLDQEQSLALFSNLKSENGPGDAGFGHLRRNYPPGSFDPHTALHALKSSGETSDLGHPRRNYPQDSAGGAFDPHAALTSLRSSEPQRAAAGNGNFDPQTALNSLISTAAASSSANTDNLGDTQSGFFSPSQIPFAADHRAAGGEGLLPGPPQNLHTVVVKARFVVLNWSPPTANGDSIQSYAVYYRQDNSERERMQNTTRSRMNEINIGGLTPDRTYHFRVVAYNAFGMGASSETIRVPTLAEEHVASAPQDFVAYATSPRSIHVNWKPPETPNGVIERYTVFYMETSSSIEHNVDSVDLRFDIIGLSVYTEYSVWVVAVNPNGPGAATEEKIVRTFSMSPSEAPQNITLEPSSTSLVVRWEPPPPESQNGVITGYKVRYRKAGKKGLTITTPANERSYVFGDLERASQYQVKVWAINVNGTSPGSEWYETSTYENDLDESRVPDKPGPLRVRPASDRLYVVWSPPANQNIKVTGYIIGWGKGIPDMYFHTTNEKTRTHIIENLEPNSEYVLSLRASNQMGPGASVYATVRTQEELPPEPQPPLIPPVGLKAQVLSSTSVILYWTDTTLSKSQYVRDSRRYVVKYVSEKNPKARYANVSDLNVMIDDLKPNTVYEFAVKLVRGKKESPWSMVVQNTTWDSPPGAAPRELDVHLKEDEPEFVEVSWQPPKTQTGRITGYVIMYTDNKTKSDREWLVQAVKGDKHSAVVIEDIRPFTEYYFKVQARNSRGYGPFSNIVIFTTGQNVGTLAASSGHHLDKGGLFSDKIMLYLVVGGCIIAVSTIAAVTAILCCRRTRDTTTSPDRSKKGYQKGTQSVKQPPDLWIHHDQMELKEKNQSNADGASSSGAMTLPRSARGVDNDYDTHDAIHSNSLDKRSYVPNYMGISPDDKNKRTHRSKPFISLSVDTKPPREPIATPINATSLSQSSSDSTPSSRPSCPRTQYNMSRAHVTVDTANQESPYAMHPHPPGWQEASSHPVVSQPPAAAHIIPPGGVYAPGLSLLAESQGGKRVQTQGHPLKSFTVPAPPPVSAPGTPQPKHIVTVRPTASPLKKPPTSVTGTPPSRITSTNPPPHSAEEVQRLHPSHSTEELNQEMANLEGLMMTLNAITANQFEC